MTQSPYRKEDLRSIHIAPDRRRVFYTLTLLLGVALGVLGVSLQKRFAPREAEAVTPAGVGLEGRTVVLPMLPPGRGKSSTVTVPEGPLVVHVWLQGCADCMPAFEAMRALSQQGGLGVPQVNVAYGAADAGWAESYGVGERLVVDPGTTVVGPLGISSFTTLVLDEHHVVRLVDRPDRPGYSYRVQGAFHALASPGGPVAPRSR